jgi:hypothetical protein
MTHKVIAGGWLLVLICVGCGSGTSAGNKAFMDEKKEIPPHLEWNREVVSRSGGAIKFRVTSQGPFAVTVVTDKGYKAMMAKNKGGFTKTDILLTVDSKENTYEGKVTIPAGSSYFIIENQSDKKVEFHLECFPAN